MEILTIQDALKNSRKRSLDRKYLEEHREQNKIKCRNNYKLKKSEYFSRQKKYNSLHMDDIRKYKREWARKDFENNPRKWLDRSYKQVIKISVELDMSYMGWRYAFNSWSKAIKKRDLGIYVYCGSIENLHAHHIIPKSKYPELSLDLNNGITVCNDCHWDIHRGVIIFH